MDNAALLSDLYGRIPPRAQKCVEGLDTDQLTKAPTPGANTIGWLIWHLTRVQDQHVSELLEVDQIWVGGDFAERVGLSPDPENTGYGHTFEQVQTVRPESPDVLLEYLGVVDRRTEEMLRTLSSSDLDRIVDEGWTPPVTMGVRLVSVASDNLQHVGQAAYLRGVLGF